MGSEGDFLVRARLDAQRLWLLLKRHPSGCCQRRTRPAIPATSLWGRSAISTFQTGQTQIRTGQPLYLKDLNCHCYDPNNTFVLNPAAWANPAPGQYGGSTYYNDFRGERRPTENFAFGRQFRIHERVTLNVRAEFTNIFNRTYLNNPAINGTGISPQTAPTCKLPNGGNGACAQPGPADCLRFRRDQHLDGVVPAANGPARCTFRVLTIDTSLGAAGISLPAAFHIIFRREITRRK